MEAEPPALPHPEKPMTAAIDPHDPVQPWRLEVVLLRRFELEYAGAKAPDYAPGIIISSP